MIPAIQPTNQTIPIPAACSGGKEPPPPPPVKSSLNNEDNSLAFLFISMSSVIGGLIGFLAGQYLERR